MTSSNGGQLAVGIIFGFLLPLAMLGFATYLVLTRLVLSPQVRPFVSWFSLFYVCLLLSPAGRSHRFETTAR